MYTKYFGFNEKPFTLTPNPRFIYLSKNHKEAFAHLLYGINNHYGFIELIGEVGTGKTTVLRTLLGQLQDEHYRSALIFNPCLTGIELLRSINHEFGIDCNSEFANELLAELNRFLLQENSKGRTIVLVIDEAQNLQPDVLEQVRLISNLETENDKLIQIILAGQPELETLLHRPDLRQLNQRIAVRYRLKSMTMNETRAYIRHRMEVAGETGGVSFGRYAIKWIYLYTHGVPRMINILCDRALLIAYGDERRNVSATTVSRAIREILNIPRRRMSWLRAGTAIAATIVMVALAGVLWRPANPKAQKKPDQSLVRTAEESPRKTGVAAATAGTSSVPPVSSTTSLPTAAAIRLAELQKELHSHDQNEAHISAFNSLMEQWEARPIRIFSGLLTVPEKFSRLSARRQLRCTEFKGTLEQALRFKVPLLVVTNVAGKLGNFCISVTTDGSDSVSVSPALFGANTLKKNDLALIAGGTYYLVWQNSGQVPDRVIQGDRRYEVRTLQRLLKQSGYYKDAINGVYNEETIKAIHDFQGSLGIAFNDRVGELTLAALSIYDRSGKSSGSGRN